ncbi:MAG: putative toxin-antitoxin system toxin component, PIN family [Burkholderiaceae bacterium]
MNAPHAGTLLVLDTNIVLDLWVFDDAAAQPLRYALQQRHARWIATVAMRDELQRVLGYPQIVPRLAHYGLQADGVLQTFDAHALIHEPAPKADVTCKDPDDQKFIDLAVMHRALLLSKDALVLAMRKRLQARGSDVLRAFTPPA